MRPFVCAILPRATEHRDHEADHRQFHTESQDLRQPYNVRTIISRHMQDSHENLQDCRKTKRYIVQFPHCSRAVIVGFSAEVVRFAAFLRQPCDKAHRYLAAILPLSCGFCKTLRDWQTITSVVQTPCVWQQPCSCPTHTNRKENENVKNLVFDVGAALRPCFSYGSLAVLFTPRKAAARNPEIFRRRQVHGCRKADVKQA